MNDTAQQSDARELDCARTEIAQCYAHYVACLYSKNIPALMDMLTSDYVLECADGSLWDADATRLLLEEQCAALDLCTTLEITIVHFKAEGRQATATVIEQTVPAAESLRGKQVAEPVVERLEEDWVFTGSTWKIRRTRVLSP